MADAAKAWQRHLLHIGKEGRQDVKWGEHVQALLACKGCRRERGPGSSWGDPG